MFKFIKRMPVIKNSVVKNNDPNDQTKVVDNEIIPGTSQNRTRFRVAYCQSPGKERSHNEDAIFVFSSVLLGVESPHSFGLYLVADGMGGHQNGEVASRLAAQASSQYLVDKVFSDTIFGGKLIPEETLSKLVSEAVHRAQNLIRQQVPGGGTTLTLAMNLGNKFFTAHVGDSRLYVINSKGELILRTKDHSLVKRLVDLGEITEHEARIHPKRNVLVRALGQIDPFEPDLDQFSINIGERLMICSDGLWGVVDEPQILSIIIQFPTLDQAACELVHAANELGGPDNISVVLVERLV
ncbi:MAG: protein phosphatase 2C domain-containing protein [Chloroflexota bacterium]|nr:protein phosphatase 2C domain-containing protein [Chloroflexota bacterium]